MMIAAVSQSAVSQPSQMIHRPMISHDHRSWWWRMLGIALAVVGAPSHPASVRSAHGQELGAVIAAGKELFEREWTPTPAGATTTLGGDGLGPVFNERSCVACHRQGGVGGGGPLDKNVDLLNLPSDKLDLSLSKGRELRRLHPGFATEEGDLNSSIVLHKFALDNSYASIRRALLGDEPVTEPHFLLLEAAQHRFANQPIQEVSTSLGLTLYRAQRNTSSLFGGGLIDQIPDSVLLALEKSQPVAFPGISGRAAPASGGIGRFGWRAKTARLSEFVLQACANEVGLQVAGSAQGSLPTHPEYRSAGLDLTPQESAALVAFVTVLPPPRQVMPQDREAQSLVMEGRSQFDRVGCSACHLETLGQVRGLYSDLLLHDLGPTLADPAPAQPDIALLVISKPQSETDKLRQVKGVNLPPLARLPQQRLVVPDKHTMVSGQKQGQWTHSIMNPPGTYYGGRVVKSDVFDATKDPNMRIKVLKQPSMIYQEWRTPPLWGVQDSAPYLHDGRAATLVEAIAWHGGEAQPSTQQFFGLAAAERLKLIAFLRTLRAPAP